MGSGVGVVTFNNDGPPGMGMGEASGVSLSLLGTVIPFRDICLMSEHYLAICRRQWIPERCSKAEDAVCAI